MVKVEYTKVRCSGWSKLRLTGFGQQHHFEPFVFRGPDNFPKLSPDINVYAGDR
jgi:hypothetical protein